MVCVSLFIDLDFKRVFFVHWLSEIVSVNISGLLNYRNGPNPLRSINLITSKELHITELDLLGTIKDVKFSCSFWYAK